MVRLPGCECVLVVVQWMQAFTARARREPTFPNPCGNFSKRQFFQISLSPFPLAYKTFFICAKFV